MRGPELACGAQVDDPLLERLLRQRVHQIQIEVVDARGAQLRHRTMRVVRRMYSSQSLERTRRKSLRAQRHSVDSRLAIAREAAALDGTGIGLERDFGVARKRDALPKCVQQPREIFGREQAGRSAA